MTKILPRYSAIAAFCLVALVGCSQNETFSVDPNSKLCNSAAGFGARIDGTAEPVEMCVSDNAAVTTFNDIGSNRYYIAADYATDDGATITIEISFVLQPITPVNLGMTSNQSLAFAEPTSVWFQYREVKANAYDYSSVSALGDFRLTVNDDGVAAAWFSGIALELLDTDGIDVGTRHISEGFISVIPDV